MVTDADVPTKEELRSAFDELITQAYHNGVVVDNGGDELRHADPKIPDWEVHITRTAEKNWTEHQPTN